MNHKTEKTLGLIRPFTLNRPEYTMNYKTEKTLCALQEEGFIESDTNAFLKLIRPAAHFCVGCGRSAVSDKNLCNPEKL